MRVRVRVHYGHLPLAIGEIEGAPGPTVVAINGKPVSHRIERIANGVALHLDRPMDMRQDEGVVFGIGG